MTTITIYGTDCFDWHSARGLLPAPASAEIPATLENRWGEWPFDYDAGTFDYDGVSDCGEGFDGFAFEAHLPGPDERWRVTRFEPIEGDDCEAIRVARFGADWRSNLRGVLAEIQETCERRIASYWREQRRD